MARYDGANFSHCCGSWHAGAGYRPKTPRTPCSSPGCAVWNNIDQLTDTDKLNGWLAAICRRGRVRLATKARRELLLSEPGMARLIDGRPSECDPCAEIALCDRYDRLYDAILALPERQRVVRVELLKRGDQSYLGLSGCLGLPVGCIGPIGQRAVTRLRLDPGIADLSAQYSGDHRQARNA